MPDRLAFSVPGVPQPQGSSRAFVRGGRAVVTSANPKLHSWRMDVAACARAAMSEAHRQAPWTGPIYVSVSFYIPAPKSVRRRDPTTRPDLDKLVRGLLDALTIAAVWQDDAQVCRIAASKVYLTQGGMTVWVERETPGAGRR